MRGGCECKHVVGTSFLHCVVELHSAGPTARWSSRCPWNRHRPQLLSVLSRQVTFGRQVLLVYLAKALVRYGLVMVGLDVPPPAGLWLAMSDLGTSALLHGCGRKCDCQWGGVVVVRLR